MTKKKIDDLRIMIQRMIYVRSLESFDALFEPDLEPIEKQYSQFAQEAEKDGRTVTFRGLYSYSFKELSDYPIITPFILAQTPEEIQGLESGNLVGKIYEEHRRASVKGTIGHPELSFVKKYTEGVAPHFLENLAKLLAKCLYPGSGRMNPQDITYSAQYVPNNEQYKGEWSFEDKKSPINNHGKFVLKKIN